MTTSESMVYTPGDGLVRVISDRKKLIEKLKEIYPDGPSDVSDLIFDRIARNAGLHFPRVYLWLDISDDIQIVFRQERGDDSLQELEIALFERKIDDFIDAIIVRETWWIKVLDYLKLCAQGI